MKFDFDKVEVFDINKARENANTPSRLKMYDYAGKISKKINESIDRESRLGYMKCDTYIPFKDIFGEAGISSREYSRLIDYIATAYNMEGYDISLCIKATTIRDLAKHSDGFLKAHTSWT